MQNFDLSLYENPVSVIIRTSQGAVTDLHHDFQDCAQCVNDPQKQCINNICYGRGSLQSQSRLLVYLTWVGTDFFGQHLVSHTLRLKKLGRFSRQNIYNSALNLF